MPLACDIDGVLADFSRGYSEEIQKLDRRAPIVNGYQQIEGWDWIGWYWPRNPDRKYVAQLIDQAWDNLRRNSTFWKNLRVLDGAGFSLVRDVYKSVPVKFITSRSGVDVEDQTRDWFHKRMVCDIDLHIVKGQETKADVCIANGVDAIIEDSPHFALNCAEFDIKVYLIDYPYNDHVEHENIVRVRSLTDALKQAGVI